MRLTPELICLDRPPADKMAAIARAAELLTDAGCVEEPFRYGMIAREATHNTYLGHGIALPHSAEQTERHIRDSGIAVIRAPEGIPWGPDAEKADTIIAIAAAHDDYLAILDHIRALSTQPENLARLKNASEAQDIINLLTLPGGNVATPASPSDTAYRQGIVYPHAPGLHPLPATALGALARELDAAIRIHAPDGRSADARDAEALAALGIVHGDAIIISAARQSAVDAVIAHICAESQTPEEAASLREDARPAAHCSALRIAGYAAAGMALLALVYWLITRIT